MARQFALIVREEEYGVPASGATLGTDKFYLPITQSGALSLRDAPVIGKISHGGGYATNACAYSDQTQIQGQLQLPLYPGAFGKFLLDWGITQINAGRTTPWASTDPDFLMPKGDLASCTIYHALEQPDGTFNRRKFTGVKVLSGSLGASRQSPVWSLSLQLQGAKASTASAIDFPEPGPNDFPCGPYTFSDLEGGLKITSVRKSYGSVAFNWTNAMAPQWFESRYAQLIKFCGRQSSINANLYMKPSPDDESTWHALTSMSSEIKLDNGAYEIKIAMPNSRWETLSPDLPLDNVFAWNGTLEGYWSNADGVDVIVSGGPILPPGD